MTKTHCTIMKCPDTLDSIEHIFIGVHFQLERVEVRRFAFLLAGNFESDVPLRSWLFLSWVWRNTDDTIRAEIPW